MIVGKHYDEADKALRKAEDAKRRAEAKEIELEPLLKRLENTAKRNAIFESIIETLGRTGP